MERTEQQSSIAPHALPFKNSSSVSGEPNPSRHVLHAPVPCRPQPLKSALTLPWSLTDPPDWMSMGVAGTGMPVQPSPKQNRLRFPNLIPTSQHASHSSSRRQGSGSIWHKQNKSQPPAKEPTVVFRLSTMPENVGSQTKPKEKKEVLLPKTEGMSGEGLREVYEMPLDLSDRGKSKSGQTPRDDSALVQQGGETLQKIPDMDKINPPPPYVPVSTPSPVTTRSTSSASPIRQEKESSNDRNHKVTSCS